ncbi:ATP-binding protein [Pseudoduganella armeniaca]|uniref:histidine kinase n=1 Tax=Pseudoduganella armeniaca TaxID=2072590 RepID=A0A2R4CC81_9BURK|nr:ATP-binding protein [Pseudoduganella armeniaca]AVR97237.1 two-component sensor histidine kinase [Pseudoduganella armeniaca]
MTRALAWLRALLQPSLTRRLLLAQMALLGLLWLVSAALIIFEGVNEHSMLKDNGVFDAVLTVAQNMDDRPERRTVALAAIDRAISEDSGAEDSHIMPAIVLTRAGQEIYRTPTAPRGVRNSRLDTIEAFVVDGVRWRARTRKSPDGTVTMMFIAPGDWKNVALTVNSRSFYLMPILVSIPFLIPPAWLSIRLALRPWNRVAQEVASRGPQDLAPLTFRPRHRELATMVESIDALMRRVDDASRRERAFIADAAHELRTPLAALRINVEALRAHAEDPGQRQLLAGIVSASARAARLVGQLLNLMRSEASPGDSARDEMVALDLDELLQERMAALSCLADAGGVDLDLAAAQQVRVRGRREGLTSLLDNLLDNAIKYSPAGATVAVSLALEEGMARLEVADAGPGIAPAWRERVFDRFFRAPDQKHSGSGLGLAIAHAVVMQHGGTIVLGEAAAGGLLATVRLPLA